MIFEDLKVYKWKDYFDESLYEEGIIKLLKDDLFRLSYNSVSYKFTSPSPSISKIIFIKKGKIEFSFENLSYQVLANEFILIPRGGICVVYADETEYFTAYLTRDLPEEIVKAEREKFPEIRMPWKIKYCVLKMEND